MRTYTPYDRKKQGSQSGKKKERKDRVSTEWDVRIDCDKTYADEIVTNIKASQRILEYAMVSGIEKSDSEQLTNGSKENHIHICLVFQYPLRRDQVLSTLRGLLKRTDEYCVPRNQKFTYAGWFMHHTKIDWELASELPIRYEYGILPHDPVDEKTKAMVLVKFKQFGRDSDTSEEENKKRFALWLD